MPTIFALSGVSGAGKTHLRTTDPVLSKIKAFDIADIYAELPGCPPSLAFALLVDKIIAPMEYGIDLVVEAYFKRGSSQREALDYIAEYNNYTVKYLELEAPLHVCIRRVKAQYEADAKAEPEREEWHRRYRDARLFFLNA